MFQQLKDPVIGGGENLPVGAGGRLFRSFVA